MGFVEKYGLNKKGDFDVGFKVVFVEKYGLNTMCQIKLQKGVLTLIFLGSFLGPGVTRSYVGQVTKATEEDSRSQTLLWRSFSVLPDAKHFVHMWT